MSSSQMQVQYEYWHVTLRIWTDVGAQERAGITGASNYRILDTVLENEPQKSSSCSDVFHDDKTFLHHFSNARPQGNAR